MPARFHADQVGSLLRPPSVLQARQRRAEGAISGEQLRAVEDTAVLEALNMQREVGLPIFSDGEFRRAAFLSEMAAAVDGFVTEKIAMRWYGPGGGEEASAAQVVGARLQQRRRLTGLEAPFLKSHAPGPFKVCVPSATLFTDLSFKPGVTDKFYASRSELLQELVGIVRNEIAWLVSDGVSYVQIDAPRYAYYMDERIRGQLTAAGRDPEAAFSQAVDADNASLAGVQRHGATIALHLCRGNSSSRWFATGGYDRIAERLFGSLDVDTFLLEYDSERSGSFEPLRFIPSGKTVVLGLISTKAPELEAQNELLRRIDEAAKVVPLENLALSPQCGFASVAAGNLLTQDDQRKKLDLLVGTARKVWG